MCAVSGALSGEILAELKGMSPPTGSYRVIYGLSRAVTPQNGKSMKHEMDIGAAHYPSSLCCCRLCCWCQFGSGCLHELLSPASRSALLAVQSHVTMTTLLLGNWLLRGSTSFLQGIQLWQVTAKKWTSACLKGLRLDQWLLARGLST